MAGVCLGPAWALTPPPLQPWLPLLDSSQIGAPSQSEQHCTAPPALLHCTSCTSCTSALHQQHLYTPVLQHSYTSAMLGSPIVGILPCTSGLGLGLVWPGPGPGRGLVALVPVVGAHAGNLPRLLLPRLLHPCTPPHSPPHTSLLTSSPHPSLLSPSPSTGAPPLPLFLGDWQRCLQGATLTGWKTTVSVR